VFCRGATPLGFSLLRRQRREGGQFKTRYQGDPAM